MPYGYPGDSNWTRKRIIIKVAARLYNSPRESDKIARCNIHILYYFLRLNCFSSPITTKFGARARAVFGILETHLGTRAGAFDGIVCMLRNDNHITIAQTSPMHTGFWPSPRRDYVTLVLDTHFKIGLS